MFSTCFLAVVYFLQYGLFWLGYVSGQNKFKKPLTQKEEAAYLERAAAGEKEAKDILVEHNLRLVAHIAKKYKNVAGCDEDDLISIGTIGLMKAVFTFDAAKKARLGSYAARCIENEILMTVRASKKQDKEISLNECLGHDTDGNEVTFMDILPSEDLDIADLVGTGEDIKKLKGFMEACLTDREREIIMKRYGLGSRPYTQQELAKQLEISRSYVSRIETKALKKLLKCYETTKEM